MKISLRQIDKSFLYQSNWLQSLRYDRANESDYDLRKLRYKVYIARAESQYIKRISVM